MLIDTGVSDWEFDFGEEIYKLKYLQKETVVSDCRGNVNIELVNANFPKYIIEKFRNKEYPILITQCVNLVNENSVKSQCKFSYKDTNIVKIESYSCLDEIKTYTIVIENKEPKIK